MQCVFEGNKDEIIKLRVRQKELEMYTSLIISVWAIVFSVFTSVDALEELTKSFNYIFPILSVIMFLFCLYKICQVKRLSEEFVNLNMQWVTIINLLIAYAII